jgi:hypothetical protein
MPLAEGVGRSNRPAPRPNVLAALTHLPRFEGVPGTSTR